MMIDVDELKKAITFTLDVLIFIFNILLFTTNTETETILLEIRSSSNTQKIHIRNNKARVESSEPSRNIIKPRSQLAACEVNQNWSELVTFAFWLRRQWRWRGNKKKVSTISQRHWYWSLSLQAEADQQPQQQQLWSSGPVKLPWKALSAQSSIRFIWVRLLWLRIVAVVVCLDLYRQPDIIDCCAASSSCSLWLKLPLHCVRLIECNCSLHASRGSSNELSITS